jgi:lipopolysaccharide export LptBFGC system permease protein LptF
VLKLLKLHLDRLLLQKLLLLLLLMLLLLLLLLLHQQLLLLLNILVQRQASRTPLSALLLPLQHLVRHT